MDLIEILFIVLSILYILYVIFEIIFLKWLRKKFKLVIHVNGIRGKSTIVRLLDAGLRENDYKVYSKTTGTVPMIIDTNNNEKIIKRLGLANIREQIKYMYKAYKNNADCIIFECMAVNKEYQEICEKKILKSDITIISNVRMDHIGEMGDNLDDLAKAMSSTIPNNGYVVTGSKEYYDLFNEVAIKNNSKCYLTDEYAGDSLDTFKENIAIALKVADILNIDKEKFFNGMKKYKKDFGALKEYKKENTIFVNGLSINDVESTLIIYKELIQKYNKEDITILLNSRSDRPTRILNHIELISTINPNKLYLLGSNSIYIKNKLKNKIKEIIILKDYDILLNDKIIFGIGNIKDDGIKLINYFKGGPNE